MMSYKESVISEATTENKYQRRQNLSHLQLIIFIFRSFLLSLYLLINN